MVGLTVQPVPNADAFNRMAWEILINPIVVQVVAARMSYVKMGEVLPAVQKAWIAALPGHLVPDPSPVRAEHAMTLPQEEAVPAISVSGVSRNALLDAKFHVMHATRWLWLQAFPMFLVFPLTRTDLFLPHSDFVVRTIN